MGRDYPRARVRILTAGNLYPPQHLGGYELMWRSSVAHQRARGHEVRVLTTDWRQPDVDRSVPEDDDVHRELRWYWHDHRFPRIGPRGRLELERHNAAILDGHLERFRPDVVCWWAMGGMSLSLIERARRAGLPAAAVVASEDEALATELQRAVMSPRFRVYVNTDVVGVELCAAAKNVIALAAGAVDGLEMGDNAKAGLITRGLAEMARLGAAAGARPETFAGLAGMGDLVVTCWSRHSRNRRAGELIARGASPDEAAAEIGQVVEGLTTAPVLRDLSRRLGVELPITEGVCGVLEGVDLGELASGLMARQPTGE